MKTVDKDYENTIIIKKSKFISIISNIDNIDEVKTKLTYYKEKYPKAKHYCYAYKIGPKEKYSDDKEPSGTAGYPILNNIINNSLDHIIIIVIRYFGGIKLGVGPLTRTYSTCAKEVINNSNLVDLVNGYYIKIKANYNDLKNLDILTKGKKINKTFNQDIIITFTIKKEELPLYSKFNIIEKRPILLKV